MSEIESMEIEKLKLELEKLREPWWKKSLGQFSAAIIGALGAATIALASSYLEVKSDLQAKPTEIKKEVISAFSDDAPEGNYDQYIVNYSTGYAGGVLRSPSGNQELERVMQLNDKDEIIKMVQNITAQTVTKIVDKIE